MEYKTYDNTILVEGKKYRWSGYSEGLYTDFGWKNFKCKIRKIDDDKIFIYDYSDNKEYKYTNEGLKRNGVTFKKKKFI
jgi:hypothetical protein